MTAVNTKYVAPVQGRRGADHTAMSGMMGESYDLTSCTCMLPTIVCQAMTEEHHNHNTASSRQSRDTMTTFKKKIGLQNYKILNALRHKAEKEERITANTQEGKAASPSRAQDGPAFPG